MRQFAPFLLLLALTVHAPKLPDFSPDTSTPGMDKGPVTWLTGDTADVQRITTGGTLLMGGSTDVDAAMRWMLHKSGGGDVVVLRASGSDGYNEYLFSKLGETINSVETILLNSAEWVNDTTVVRKIRNAEALFIAGGNQANYVNYWKDSKVEEAINYLIHVKKVPVGGTSAGCAILGQVYYPALNASVTSDQALTNPYNADLMLGHTDFIDTPFLANTITDTHFSQRDRRGRLAVFLARMRTDWNLTTIRGIGIDERTAVCVEANGVAHIFGTGTAHFVTPVSSARPEQCEAGKPLHWLAGKKAIRVIEISATAADPGTFNVATWAVPSSNTTRFWYVENGQLIRV